MFETTIVPNQHLIRGQVFAAQDKPGVPSGKKLTLKTRDAEFSAMPDPRATGVTLYMRSNYTGSNSVDRYSLPASGWSVRGTKYMYKDSRLVNGPIKAAKIDLLTGSVTINGKGAKLTHSLAVMPDSMDVVLLTGGQRVLRELWAASNA